jgi:phosphatidate cytidylyltransferase
MLKKRILTAAVLIPVTLLALFFLPTPGFFIFTGIISLGAAWEWSNLMQLKTIRTRFIYVIISAIVFVWAATLPVFVLFSNTFLWWLVATWLVITYPQKSQWWQKSMIARGLMGLFAIAPCFVALNLMREQRDGIYSLLFVLLLIWGADTAAYFSGKKWGSTKMAPRVSPNKTMQGLYGALIFSVLFAILALWFFHLPYSMWVWAILLSIVTVIFSIIGDLFESMMKREAGLKDSGKLLPGHGGLLDRIDSLLSAAPVFVLGGLLLSKLV